MRYVSLVLILVLIGCYSGIHTSSFISSQKDGNTSSCHSQVNGHIQHHEFAKINIQLNKYQEKQSCCNYFVSFQFESQKIIPTLNSNEIDYFSFKQENQSKNIFTDKNLKNHSPPNIYISKSSFLI